MWQVGKTICFITGIELDTQIGDNLFMVMTLLLMFQVTFCPNGSPWITSNSNPLELDPLNLFCTKKINIQWAQHNKWTKGVKFLIQIFLEWFNYFTSEYLVSLNILLNKININKEFYKQIWSFYKPYLEIRSIIDIYLLFFSFL